MNTSILYLVLACLNIGLGLWNISFGITFNNIISVANFSVAIYLFYIVIRML